MPKAIGVIKQSPTRKVKETMFLRWDFSDAELKQFSSDMARNSAEQSEAEESKKAVVAQFTEKISAAKAKVSSLARKINSGYEMRDVRCEIWLDFPEAGRARILRLDTNEIVSERAMSETERQMVLDFDSSIGAGKEKPDVT